MVDGAIGTFNVQQQASFGAGNTALTLSGASLNLELNNSGVDQLAVNVGKASVSGTNTVNFTPIGSGLTIGGNYTLVSSPAGGLTGNFQFANGSQSKVISSGGNSYTAILYNTPTAESVSIHPGPPTIIQDTFVGSGNINTNMPNLANLPGNSWQNAGVNDQGSPNYGTNQANLPGNNGGVVIGLTSGSYTPPTVLTVSATMRGGSTSTDYENNFRGPAVGFISYVPISTNNICNSGFQGMALNGDGTVAVYLATAPFSSATGQFEYVFPGNGASLPPGSATTPPITINYNSVFGAPFSSSNFYTVSYTINTVSGVISNVSLSNGVVTDTADFTSIDGQVTTITGAATAFFGIAESGFGGQPNGIVQSVTLSGVATSGNAWTGLANDSAWPNPGNWSLTVPGATSGTTNTDTALFNATVSSTPTSIDAGRNVMNITFDTANVSPMIIGTTTGNALLLSAGGVIQTTSAVTNLQTVNAPLVLEGAYSFTSGATSSSATLNFGGGITPAATSGITTLTLNGTNTGTNTLSGVLADNGAGKLAVSVSGTGLWVYSGATNSYTGGTTIAASGTLRLAGSVSTMSQSMNVANSGSLVVASSTNQNVGTVTGTGTTVVNSGSLTAYQIRQNSLTINGTSTVTLIPSGSGTNSTPAAPNNINFSSNVNSLTIAGTTDAWTGTLDIGNNGLVIQYGSGTDPYTTVVNMIKSGYANGHWTGTGITSSLARAAVVLGSPTPALNIGLLDFVPNTGLFGSSISFEGQTISTNAILVRLTYMDDLVLAGDMQQANATSDALFFAANYGSGTTWHVGDITHDGVIDTNDALLFAANYVVGLPSLDGTTGNAAALGGVGIGGGGIGGGSGAVPEPASIVLALSGMAAMFSVIRRRRRSSTAS